MDLNDFYNVIIAVLDAKLPATMYSVKFEGLKSPRICEPQGSYSS